VLISAVAPEDDGYRRALGLHGMKRNQFLAAVSAAQLCFGATLALNGWGWHMGRARAGPGGPR